VPAKDVLSIQRADVSDRQEPEKPGPQFNFA
jgi:hypothetical protein